MPMTNAELQLTLGQILPHMEEAGFTHVQVGIERWKVEGLKGIVREKEDLLAKIAKKHPEWIKEVQEDEGTPSALLDEGEPAVPEDPDAEPSQPFELPPEGRNGEKDNPDKGLPVK